MDHRDPAVTDGFARDREVILFNNAGVSSSSGECHYVRENGRKRDGLHQGAGSDESQCARLFDWRLYRAENRTSGPDLVRRLVLVGTGPRGSEVATFTPEAQEIFGATYDDPYHLWLRPPQRQHPRSLCPKF